MKTEEIAVEKKKEKKKEETKRDEVSPIHHYIPIE